MDEHRAQCRGGLCMCGELGMIMSASRTVAQRQSRSRARRIVMVRRIAPRRRSVRLHRVAASRQAATGCISRIDVSRVLRSSSSPFVYFEHAENSVTSLRSPSIARGAESCVRIAPRTTHASRLRPSPPPPPVDHAWMRASCARHNGCCSTQAEHSY